MSSLNGKHVVVTGATGALGSAVVAALLERGAECHVPMREAALPAHLPWHADSRVHAVANMALDDEAAVTDYYAALPSLWASIHLVGGFAMKPLVDVTLADLRAQLDINAVTSFLCCREAARKLQKSGGGGRLVNVTARASVNSAPGMLAYTMAKAAVTSLTQSLAAELLGDGILVNAVSPSLIDSPANRASMPDADFAKWPKASEIAAAIVYLASPENALTSGAIVPVHGRA